MTRAVGRIGGAIAAITMAVGATIAAAQDAADSLPEYARLRLTPLVLGPDAPRNSFVSVEHLTTSADGTRIAVATRTTVRVIDAHSGAVLRTVHADGEAIEDVGLTPDGRRLVIAEFAGAVRLIDVESGKEEKPLDLSSDVLTTCAISPNASTVTAARYAGLPLQIWNVDAPQSPLPLERELVGVADVVFARDGTHIVVSKGQETLLLAIEDLAERGRCTFSGSRTALDRAGRRVVITSIVALTVADLVTGQKLWEVNKFGAGGSAVAMSPDGKLVAIGGMEAVRILDGATGTERCELRGHQGPVTALHFADDGETLVSGDQSGSVLVWNLERKLAGTARPPAAENSPPATDTHGDVLPTGAVARFGTTRMRSRGWAYALAFAPDGTWLAAGEGHALSIWDTETGLRLRELSSSIGDVQSMSVSPDGAYLACTAANSDEVHRWDARTWRALPSLRPPKGGVPGAVAFSPDGALLVTHMRRSQGKRGIAAWSTATSALIYERREDGPPGHDATYRNRRIAFVGDQHLIAAEGQYGAIELRTPIDGGIARTLTGEQDAVLSGDVFAFSPDGKLLAVPTQLEPTCIELLDALTLRSRGRLGEITTEFGSLGSTTNIAFTPDGRYLVVAGEASSSSGDGGAQPGEVRVFDVATRKLVSRWAGPGGVPLAMIVSADGLHAAWAGRGAQIHVARLPGLEPTIAAAGHDAEITCVRALHDSDLVLTAGRDGTVRKWDARTGAHLGVVLSVGQAVDALDVSADGKRVAVAGSDLGLIVAAIDDGRRILEVGYEYLGQAVAVAFAGNGDRVCVALDNGSLHMVDAATGTIDAIRESGSPYDFAARLFSLPDGRVISSGSAGVVLIDPAADEIRQLLPDLTDAKGGAATDPGLRVIATVEHAGQLTVWDAVSGKARFRKKIAQGWLGESPWALPAVSPDGKLVAATKKRAGSIVVWAAKSGEEVARFAATAWVTSIAFGADGNTVIAGLSDTTALVFKLP